MGHVLPAHLEVVDVDVDVDLQLRLELAPASRVRLDTTFRSRYFASQLMTAASMVRVIILTSPGSDTTQSAV
jgi:hypothetical protein